MLVIGRGKSCASGGLFPFTLSPALFALSTTTLIHLYTVKAEHPACGWDQGVRHEQSAKSQHNCKATMEAPDSIILSPC